MLVEPHVFDLGLDILTFEKIGDNNNKFYYIQVYMYGPSKASLFSNIVLAS
jgi:hypothetical protein